MRCTWAVRMMRFVLGWVQDYDVEGGVGDDEGCKTGSGEERCF